MTCTHHVAGRCTNGLALPIYGDDPSPGVCAICPYSSEAGSKPQELPTRNLIQKGLSWAKAEGSLFLQGPVSTEDYVRRLETCNACPNLQRAESPSQLGWCSKCGCGDRGRAELTVKGKMPAATCPYDYWAKDVPRSLLSDELRQAIYA